MFGWLLISVLSVFRPSFIRFEYVNFSLLLKHIQNSFEPFTLFDIIKKVFFRNLICSTRAVGVCIQSVPSKNRRLCFLQNSRKERPVNADFLSVLIVLATPFICTICSNNLTADFPSVFPQKLAAYYSLKWSVTKKLQNRRWIFLICPIKSKLISSLYRSLVVVVSPCGVS